MLFFVWFIVCIALIKNYRYSHPDLYDFDRYNDEVPIHLDDLMIVFLLQHVIFLVCRPFFFCCYAAVAPFYDLGKKYDEFDDLSFSIISFDYIKYVKHTKNDNDATPSGWAEYTSMVRNDQIRAYA